MDSELYHLDSELIILETEKNPYLYDTRHSDFKNRELKRDAWMAVTKNVIGEQWDQMDENRRSNVGKEVQKRWKSMKDSYLKSIKNDVGRSSDPGKAKKPYVYHKQMAFLQAVYKQRETLGNMITEEVMNTSVQASEAVRTEEPAIVAGLCSRMPNRRKSDLFEKEILNVLKANLDQQPKIQDPDEMFLLSQLPLIKKMKPSDKLQFQIHFMQLIQEYSNPNSNSFEGTSISPDSDLSSISATSRVPSTADRQEDEDCFVFFPYLNLMYM